ncbi:B12-binding domain-containing protein [candidate division KSB1 bacterium]
MSNDELRSLIQSINNYSSSGNGLYEKNLLIDPHYHYNKCVQTVKEFDPQALHSSLNYTENFLNKRILIEHVIIPLLHTIGVLWESNKIKIAHEHAATAVIRTYISNLKSSMYVPDNAPSVIIATPAGQHHEIGAIIASITAISEGWNALYMGADLPVQEIIYTVQIQKAKVIALSIIYPENNPDTRKEIADLKAGISDKIYLVAGGRASQSYKDLFSNSKNRLMHDFDEFRLLLRNLNSQQ